MEISTQNRIDRNDDFVLDKSPKSKRAIIEVFVDKCLDNYFENYEKSNQPKRQV